jgi:CheY-like chemotaxis protein
VILLDAMMPGMDGFEVARRLKADFTTRTSPSCS